VQISGLVGHDHKLRDTDEPERRLRLLLRVIGATSRQVTASYELRLAHQYDQYRTANMGWPESEGGSWMVALIMAQAELAGSVSRQCLRGWRMILQSKYHGQDINAIGHKRISGGSAKRSASETFLQGSHPRKSIRSWAFELYDSVWTRITLAWSRNQQNTDTMRLVGFAARATTHIRRHMKASLGDELPPLAPSTMMADFLTTRYTYLPSQLLSLQPPGHAESVPSGPTLPAT
jgi:hypothetical protein